LSSNLNNLYSEALDWLFSQFPSYQNIGASAYKPDLGNIRQLCAFFDNPQNDIKFIHVAGTNGKGSVSSMLSSILTESGEKTGLFTSPHIHDFRERIRINGEMISEEEVISFCNHLRTSALNFEPSFFEITYCMALVHFKRNNCSIAVIETGLGGRLDATNIITPILSIITNISLEHTQFLGNDLASIAGEKAGIIKPHVPVVIGRSSIETHEVFKNKATNESAKIIFCDDLPLPDAFSLPLLGHYQQENVRTVYAAVGVLNQRGFNLAEAHILQGLKNLKGNTGIFGRMEVIQRNPLIILDVSHNEEGIRSTLDFIQSQNKGKLFIIYGSSADKDLQSILPLFPSNSHLSFCAFSNSRSLTIDQLKEIASSKNPESKCFKNIFEALEEIKTLAKTEDTILVFGSFFLISDYYGVENR
jgi:dihydrofolate synthase/folylpolyglutamate synthase